MFGVLKERLNGHRQKGFYTFRILALRSHLSQGFLLDVFCFSLGGVCSCRRHDVNNEAWVTKLWLRSCIHDVYIECRYSLMYHNLNSCCSLFGLRYFDMCEGADGLRGSEFGSYEHANEPSGFIKGGEFFGQLRGYQLYRNGCTPRNWFFILFVLLQCLKASSNIFTTHILVFPFGNIRARCRWNAGVVFIRAWRRLRAEVQRGMRSVQSDNEKAQTYFRTFPERSSGFFSNWDAENV
jgi:hypothetical protein